MTLTLPTAKAGGFSAQRPLLAPWRSLCNLPERIGSGVSRPTVYTAYADKRRPSFKIFFAAFMSRLWTALHTGHTHSLIDRSFVPGH